MGRSTLRKVKNCTKEAIVISTFMLESQDTIAAFVDQIGQINKGFLFYISAASLGRFSIVDYIAGKRKLVR